MAGAAGWAAGAGDSAAGFSGGTTGGAILFPRAARRSIMISKEVLGDGDHFSSLVRSERREIKNRSVVESVREASAFISAIAEDVDSIRVCGFAEIRVTRRFLKYWARSRVKRIRSRPSIASSRQSGRRSAARPSRSAVANL